MFLTTLQSQKVSQIVNHFNNGNNRVDFKAPTGSGKTLMATAVISKMINTNPDKKMLFIIATISNSDLPEQFERKINEYKGDLEYNDFNVEYIRSPSNNDTDKSPKDMQIQIIPEQNKVYIFGKSTFGKNRIITEQKIIDDFVDEAIAQHFTICYIRDEAHIGTKSLPQTDIKTFETLMQNHAHFILKMTATLNFRDLTTQKVELTEKELNDPSKNDNKWLIKTTPMRLYNDTIDDESLLDNAIKQFIKIKSDYSKLNCIIKPAMLIQVDNEPTDIQQKQLFFDTLEMIKHKLTDAGLSWVKYFGNTDKEQSNIDNNNFTLNKITRNNDTTDCIIFKIGPATGWDIPRACMLLQLRNVCSSNLNTQTVGRIKRNPYPNLEKNDITDKFYLYSNNPNEPTDFSVYEYNVKTQYTTEEFASIVVNKTKDIFDKTKLPNLVANFLQNKHHDILVKLNESFDDTKNIYINTNQKITINSPILLLKHLHVMEKNLTNYQSSVFTEIKKQYTNTSLSNCKYESIKIILLSHFMTDINNIAQKCIENNIKYELQMHKLDRNSYIEIKSDEPKNRRQTTSNYLFSIKKDGSENNIQNLDSFNENIVFEKICSYIDFCPDTLHVWAKNPTSGNVYGEYLDENKYFKRSYFDFILKYDNGILLYIEVKGEDDIDENKTQLLRTAYADYFEKEKHDLFQQKIIICLARVNGDSIIPELFYDKSLLNLSDRMNFPQILQTLGTIK